MCGDIRLGPAHLPESPVRDLLKGYSPFGGLSPVDFLDKWHEGGEWKYPKSAGFQISPVTGEPLARKMTMSKGTRLDRFGSEEGSYLAPHATPFSMRAIPPQSMSVVEGSDMPALNYHEYVVEHDLEVLEGPTAPAFGQPGQGQQFKTDLPVKELVNKGILRRVDTNNASKGSRRVLL